MGEVGQNRPGHLALRRAASMVLLATVLFSVTISALGALFTMPSLLLLLVAWLSLITAAAREGGLRALVRAGLGGAALIAVTIASARMVYHHRVVSCVDDYEPIARDAIALRGEPALGLDPRFPCFRVSSAAAIDISGVGAARVRLDVRDRISLVYIPGEDRSTLRLGTRCLRQLRGNWYEDVDCH